ncbi:MAG: sugar phosphate isomerase/epimerase [Oscillospiraceae bacterium]|jgi:sugar phosphate isomerase/epimerase|nr:sugar phosphate isomerase/epimerase [Oscillospiraceae bacterium]
MKDFRIGAQLYSVRTLCQTAEGFADTMEKISAIGYKGVQVSGIGDIAPKTVRDICGENKLEIVCTHVPYKEITEDTQSSIEKHKVYGCAYPGLGSIPQEFYEEGAAGLHRFIEAFNKAAEEYAANGMRLLYHNHAHEFQRMGGKLALDILMENITEKAQFEIDTHWVQVGGRDPARFLREKRSADVIHFKDLLGGLSNNSVIATVGKGNLDWDGIIAACRDTRVKWAMVEQDNAVDEADPIGCLAYAFEFLMKKGCLA